MKSKSYPKEGTQKRIILDCLIEANGQFIGVNILMRRANSAAVHSAISELRRNYGWHIENRVERINNDGKSVAHSIYRLVIGQQELELGI